MATPALCVGLVVFANILLLAPRAQGTEQQLIPDSFNLLPNLADVTNPATVAIVPPEILTADTAITVRYAFALAVVVWDGYAACDPADKALNFWGQKERLPKEVCTDPQTPGLVFGYSLVRALEREFLVPAESWASFMQENGFDPEDRSTDVATAVGFGNVIGARLADWLAKDGWNSLGDLSRGDFRQPFEDYTGYEPVNPSWALDYPLRWQPLTQEDPIRIGRYITQSHVVPFLGQIRPLLISEEELAAKQAPMPYEDMNSTELSGKDKETMDALVMDLFEISANLTREQRVLARWWDNKLFSVGFFLPVFTQIEGFDRGFNARWLLGEMVALYDAMVVVWKEKRRIDAVRPESILADFYEDQEVIAYVPEEGKAKTVKAGDWKPLIPTQPHSEYPSASTTLCTAFADFSELLMREHMEAKGLDSEVPFVFKLNPAAFPFEFTEGLEEIKFDTLKEAGKSCGESRLWAGVHFGPSVAAGEKLAEGLGQKASDFAWSLANGEVPENCWWCIPS